MTNVYVKQQTLWQNQLKGSISRKPQCRKLPNKDQLHKTNFLVWLDDWPINIFSCSTRLLTVQKIWTVVQLSARIFFYLLSACERDVFFSDGLLSPAKWRFPLSGANIFYISRQVRGSKSLW